MPTDPTAAYVREEFLVPSAPGIELFVRGVRLRDEPPPPGVPVLLLHGARAAGVASFDLPVAGGSLAADLAAAGHPVFVLDARGYGGSTRPPVMGRPPAANPPLVRSHEVVRDIAAAVEAIQARAGAARVALLGWATGGHWLGFYASLHPERVSHLIVLNTLYGRTPGHPSLGRGSDLEDPDRPGRFAAAAVGAYRLADAAALLRSWDGGIPLADKGEWRDPAVAEAYTAAALASDPESGRHDPPAFRVPNGALEDSFYLAIGRQLWDAASVTAPTLIVRGGRDFWSRPADVQRLADDLVHAPAVERLDLPDATHHLHLDRPERGRDLFLQTVLDLLGR